MVGCGVLESVAKGRVEGWLSRGIVTDGRIRDGN